MRLVVGLGNPEERYSYTRHNAGFLAVETLSRKQTIQCRTKRFDSYFGKGMIGNVSVVLAKPQTFMNLSGVAVGRLARFFKIDASDIIVIHDDLDLPFTDVRIKVGGGDGGHKGLRSIINCLGGSEFVRIRLGIGKPVRKEMTDDHVLERFSEDEMRDLTDVLTTACDAVIEVISSGTQAAMNKFNVRVTKNSSKEVGA